MKRNCFKCDKDIKTDFDGEFRSPPIDATAWMTHGNYGSTVYDPMGDFNGNPEYLELYVCDECLKNNSNKVYRVYPVHTVTHEVEIFEEYRKKELQEIEENKNKSELFKLAKDHPLMGPLLEQREKDNE